MEQSGTAASVSESVSEFEPESESVFETERHVLFPTGGAMIQSRSDRRGSRATVGEADPLAHAREMREKRRPARGTQPTPGWSVSVEDSTIECPGDAWDAPDAAAAACDRLLDAIDLDRAGGALDLRVARLLAVLKRMDLVHPNHALTPV